MDDVFPCRRIRSQTGSLMVAYMTKAEVFFKDILVAPLWDSSFEESDGQLAIGHNLKKEVIFHLGDVSIAQARKRQPLFDVATGKGQNSRR
ncbi:hypothetical protein LOAG_11988 [Loa loa]|uniref:Uncharacterized protein n=1 Tax=Loa loa TaxID=7209 RepID=A0A1I7VNV9_LOALO|nr:hypothetical protein LOAG_11988 [Loa loa]EFO16518.1 hypothetical protein LOAG_11988 [Loa loa]